MVPHQRLIATNQRLSMLLMRNIVLRLTGLGRPRADHCLGWWSYVGSFGEDFFSDDD